MIVVSGRLQIRPWADKDGNKRKSAEIVADNVYFGGSKSDTSTPTPVAVPYGGEFPETEALLQSYGVPPADSFAVLEGDDSQLPF